MGKGSKEKGRKEMDFSAYAAKGLEEAPFRVGRRARTLDAEGDGACHPTLKPLPGDLTLKSASPCTVQNPTSRLPWKSKGVCVGHIHTPAYGRLTQTF